MEIAGETKRGKNVQSCAKKCSTSLFERLVLHFVFKDISPQIVNV